MQRPLWTASESLGRGLIPGAHLLLDPAPPEQPRAPGGGSAHPASLRQYRRPPSLAPAHSHQPLTWPGQHRAVSESQACGRELPGWEHLGRQQKALATWSSPSDPALSFQLGPRTPLPHGTVRMSGARREEGGSCPSPGLFLLVPTAPLPPHTHPPVVDLGTGRGWDLTLRVGRGSWDRPRSP